MKCKICQSELISKSRNIFCSPHCRQIDRNNYYNDRWLKRDQKAIEERKAEFNRRQDLSFSKRREDNIA